MKKFVLVVVVVLAVFVIYMRNRLYVRDPLGSVTRNGVKEAGAQVYINYPNEVLLVNDNAPAYVLLVQAGDRVGVPKELKCMHWVVCLSDADKATLLEPVGMHVESMSNKLVAFRDEQGREVQVKLR